MYQAYIIKEETGEKYEIEHSVPIGPSCIIDTNDHLIPVVTIKHNKKQNFVRITCNINQITEHLTINGNKVSTNGHGLNEILTNLESFRISDMTFRVYVVPTIR